MTSTKLSAHQIKHLGDYARGDRSTDQASPTFWISSAANKSTGIYRTLGVLEEKGMVAVTWINSTTCQIHATEAGKAFLAALVWDEAHAANALLTGFETHSDVIDLAVAQSPTWQKAIAEFDADTEAMVSTLVHLPHGDQYLLPGLTPVEGAPAQLPLF